MTERMENQILTALESDDDFVPKALMLALWREYGEREAECRRLAAAALDRAHGDAGVPLPSPSSVPVTREYLWRVVDALKAWAYDTRSEDEDTPALAALRKEVG